ncbi:iron chaperone [Streptomyces lavendulocolor]|uniref:iron chaperone n=1 Tax=Streptomyces lavendulocolor TaxID=67316 RepID=UPI0031CFE58D
MKVAQKPAGTSEVLTDEERDAIKARARELKASARRGSRADKAAEDEAAVLAKIAEMQGTDRVMAERLHAVVKESAPELAPKLWYGMPAYAKGGKVVCFFQSAQKFRTRYATFGFSDLAALDDGAMWPASYALKELTAADEARIGALVRRAVG